MKKNRLYVLWGLCFIVCAGLGFIPEVSGFGRIVLTLLGILFFLPPALLVQLGVKTDDRESLRLIRNLSALSLGLTLLCMVGNILSALGPVWLGDFLYGVLGVVSAPMFCCGSWALSLFLWACLLLTARKFARVMA